MLFGLICYEHSSLTYILFLPTIYLWKKVYFSINADIPQTCGIKCAFSWQFAVLNTS